MTKMSSLSLRRIEGTISALEEELDIQIEYMNVALSHGDQRENASLDLIRPEVAKLQQKLDSLRNLISDVEIIELPDGIICPGRFVKIRDLNRLSSPVVYLYDRVGTTLLNGTLNISTPLGSAIDNKKPGIFEVQTPSGRIQYSVELVEDNYLDEFLKQYPVDETKRLSLMYGDL